MEKSQIITKLKGLRQIKPAQEWQEDTKSFILGPIQPQEKVFSGDFLLSFGRLFNPSKLAPALIPSIIVVLAGAGIFAHFYFSSPEDPNRETGGTEITETQEASAVYLALAETKLKQLESAGDIKKVADILEKAADTISFEPKNSAEMAKIVELVTNINKKVQEIDLEEESREQERKEIGDLKAQASVLTSVTAQVLEEDIRNITKELVENLIEMIKTRTLSHEQEELFEQAKTNYNKENYQQALEKILFLTSRNEITNDNNQTTSDSEQTIKDSNETINETINENSETN